jgi:membrane-bound lytic murein transglycosylase F
MNQKRKKKKILLIGLALMLFACENESPISAPDQPSALRTQIQKDDGSLAYVLKRREIVMITVNNAHCYYQYRDRLTGFEYELGKDFAEYLGVDLKVKTARGWEEMWKMLDQEKGAFIAANLIITEQREKLLAFADDYMTVDPHIIVHRNNKEIRTWEDLSGQTVHVSRGTSYQERLESLQKQGVAMDLVLHDKESAEDLIRQVAEGEIGITVAASHIGLLNQRYYPQTVIAGAIGSIKERMAWAVLPDAQQLLKQINAFFKTIKRNGRFQEIYNRYYSDIESFDYVDLKIFHERISTRLPEYISLIKKNAEKHGFDWRLIAAQMYQESHFNPKARSQDGAYGLMQILPPTGNLNAADLFDPEQNIEAGITHLKFLYDFFDNVQGKDRVRIALAAYNAGQGHIQDARNLAQSSGLDPDKWDSLVKILPLLEKEEYFRDSVYGFCRGREPVEYVRKIMIYYDILKSKDDQKQL